MVSKKLTDYYLNTKNFRNNFLEALPFFYFINRHVYCYFI